MGAGYRCHSWPAPIRSSRGNQAETGLKARALSDRQGALSGRSGKCLFGLRRRRFLGSAWMRRPSTSARASSTAASGTSSCTGCTCSRTGPAWSSARVAGPRPATRQNQFGLTRRELEVLALVNAGFAKPGDRRPARAFSPHRRPSRGVHNSQAWGTHPAQTRPAAEALGLSGHSRQT